MAPQRLRRCSKPTLARLSDLANPRPTARLQNADQRTAKRIDPAQRYLDVAIPTSFEPESNVCLSRWLALK
jgi:hypothetical protein